MTAQNYNVANLVLPREGPTVISAIADLTTASDAQIDLTNFFDRDLISYIQGAFIDNFDGNEALSLQLNSGTKQRIISPANSQVALPLFVQQGSTQFTLSSISGNSPAIVVPVFFYNIPLQPIVISAANAGGTISGPAMTDYSFELTGGNDTVIAAGNAARYLLIQNPTGNADITVNIAGGDATASGVVIEAGASIEIAGGTLSAVNVAGATAETINVFGGA